MQIIIKGSKGFDIFEENQDYLEQKFRKFEKMVKEPTILEFTFHHTHGTRANIDKRIHLTVTMPGMKKPEHLEEVTPHFNDTIDRLYERFEKFFQRWKDRSKIGTRYPKKYYVAKRMEEENKEI